MLQTKYITVEELKEYEPDLDLIEILGSKEKAIAFIHKWEERLATWLDVKFFQRIDFRYPEFSDYQKQCYKRALMEQCIYVWRNGDISTDSGYDPHEGEKVNRTTIKKLKFSDNTIENLEACGLLSRKIFKSTRYGGGRWPL